MDPTIISAAITAITSVATCLFGLHAGRKDAASPSIIKIRERQIESLYAPLEIVLNNHEVDLAKTLISVRVIMEQNYSIVPPILLSNFQKIDTSKTPTLIDLSDLHKSVSSFYNWTRRSLGYPYDSSAIKRGLTPTYERNSTIAAIATLVAFLIWSVCAYITIMVVTMQLPSTLPDWALSAAPTIAIIGVPWILTIFTQSRKR